MTDRTRPLPDGPGWWHLAGGGLAKVSEGPGCAGWCVDDVVDNTLAKEALKQVREPWEASRPLHVSELPWLTIDGKAVRCVPPEVTRG